MDKKLYAFWKYDLCPYMLGAEIEKFTELGNIVPKGYQGHSFKPIAILADEEGKQAIEELDKIKNEFRKRDLKLKKELGNEALKLVYLK